VEVCGPGLVAQGYVHHMKICGAIQFGVGFQVGEGLWVGLEGPDLAGGEDALEGEDGEVADVAAYIEEGVAGLEGVGEGADEGLVVEIAAREIGMEEAVDGEGEV
jgi:hypothetical protein